MMQRTQPEREGGQPHTLTCRVCGSANVTPSGRRNHLDRETHHCDDCGAQFRDERGNAQLRHTETARTPSS
jgi:transcription elongation factor Elf1